MKDTRRWAAVAGLLAVAAGLPPVAAFFARRWAWAAAILTGGAAIWLGFYLAVKAWPRLPRPDLTYRLTRSGIVYVAAIFAVAFGALSSGNNLVFLLLAVMLAALLVSGFASRLNLAELELQCAVPEHVFAGQEAPARFQLRNLKSWTPSFAIRLRMDLPAASGAVAPEVYFPMLAGGQSASAVVSVRFPARGQYRQESFSVESAFPFGFLAKSAALRLPRDILVYPSVVPTAPLEASLLGLAEHWDRQRAGLGQDFYRLRPYRSGDSSRVVH